MNRKQQLLVFLRTLVSEIFPDSSDPDINTHIQDLGFNSKTLVIFTDRVSHALDNEIHPGVFFEHTTLDLFAEFLIDHQASNIDQFLQSRNTPERRVPSSAISGNSARNKDSGELDGWQSFDLSIAGASDSNTSNQGSAEQSDPQARNYRQEREVPVIIGGGISGMLISDHLSKDGVEHIVIGNPEIGDSPKLGESMTEVVSIEFAKKYQHLSEHLYPKECTPFFMGDLVAGLRFDFFKSLSGIFIDENVPPSFIHIDRIGFDRALYDEVQSSPKCRWIDSRVEEIEHCSDSDKILSLTLSNGQKLHPSYAWDCTNHVRLLGRKIGIPHTDLDAPREVVFTHYFHKDEKDLCREKDLPWMHATSLLSADEEFDELQGVSWLIPLGNYVSVGISMLPEDIGDRTAEEIMALLTKAYARRGLDFSSHFVRRKEVVRVPSQHFMYDRFTGPNWALVGGSSSSTWFTSGSNLSIVSYMASIASKIVENPTRYSEHYTRHIEGFLKTQKIYNTFMDSEIGSVDALKFLSGIVEQARRRISSFFMAFEEEGGANSNLAQELWSEDAVVDKEYFDFLRTIAVHAQPSLRSEQTRSIFEKFSAMKAQDENVRLPYLRTNPIRSRKPDIFMAEA